MIKLNYKRKQSESSSNPVLMSFEKNIPSKELLEDLEFQVYQPQEPRKKHQTMLASTNNDRFEYYGKQLDNKSGTKYLIGVMSDKKGEMDVYDIDHTYSLNQILKSDKARGAIESNIAKSDKNIWELKQDLVANLGTKKAQRKVQKMLSNMIDEEKISQKAEMAEYLKQKSSTLQQQVESQMVDQRKQEESQKREFLPEFDTQAQDPSQIYDVHSIISREEFENIKCESIMIALKKQEKSKQGDEISALVKHYCEYSKSLILNYESNFSQINKCKASKSYILKYIIYLDFLLKFASKKSFTKSSMEEVAKETKVDLLYTKNILQKFYQATPQPDNKVLYVRSQSLQDKFLCHIIVLVLIMFGFKVDGAPLIKALRIDQKKLISYAKECGCSVQVKDNPVKKANAPLNIVQLSLNTPFKLQPTKKPMKDKK